MRKPQKMSQEAGEAAQTRGQRSSSPAAANEAKVALLWLKCRILLNHLIEKNFREN